MQRGALGNKVPVVNIVFVASMGDTGGDRRPPAHGFLDDGAQQRELLTIVPLRAAAIEVDIYLGLHTLQPLGVVAHGQQETLNRAANSKRTGDGHHANNLATFGRVEVGLGLRPARLLLHVLEEGSGSAGHRMTLVHGSLDASQVGGEEFGLEGMTKMLLLAPGAELVGQVSQPGDNVGQGTGRRDALEEAKRGFAQKGLAVRSAPADSGDGAGRELLDPLNVVAGVVGHQGQESVALTGRVGMETLLVAGSHELVAHLALALPCFVVSREGKIVAAGAVIRQIDNDGPVRVDVGPPSE